MKKLSCREARQIDLVEYLAALGHQPKNIRNQDYWYCSPFRDEKTPSFKVNRARSIWYDFGEGKGGDIIDFGVEYFSCSVSELLEGLSKKSLSLNFSFHSPAFAGEKKEPGYGKIIILKDRALGAPPLVQYLQKRCIPKEIAAQYCREIDFELYGKKFSAIGFANDKGGFELRNEHFKAGSSPKAITFLVQGGKELTVFEGFFDFLSFQTLYKNNPTIPTNILVLNSLSFFHQAKDLMDKHQRVHLYLDRNKQGIEFTRQALLWDEKKYKDLSTSFAQGQDMNDWLIEKSSLVDSGLMTENLRYRHRKGRSI
ncbi:CHC2 zinc finger domain-containing protein [Agriterribacter humi]|uniref:CHC2 zinc finger domain-containing protein n=1 Tax=Agriterribacter humi TaxID=1104781 RepID=UPI001264A86B|nr:toprim domain-containing protein [Agriterribacter humi]